MSAVSRRTFFGQATASLAALSSLNPAARADAAKVHPAASSAVPIPGLRVAILGDPSAKVEWTDAALEALKSIGFNTVQLNIAWGDHVFDEPLNLIDVVTLPAESPLPTTPARHAEIERRAALAKRHGLRTLFHFGSPYLDYNPHTGEVSRIGQGGVDDNSFDSNYDVSNPKVAQHELDLLQEFRRSFPDVDDILVYTYDQDAWQTAEFQRSKYSDGVPLSERLPEYVKKLHHVWTDGRADTHRMWWEPWELSAGQVFAILPQLPRSGFGLMIHTNIGEVQRAVPVDLWFRNTARICHDLGIPVVAEAFWASHNEELEPLEIPAPRLADEAWLAIMRQPGIAGIKEYYGLQPTKIDLDTEVLRIRLSGFTGDTQEMLKKIAELFGSAAREVFTYLNLLSDARQMYPSDASWFGREIGKARVDHGWSAAFIRGQQANTPAWRSTRKVIFMMTDDAQPPFWLLEDIQLRCQIAADTTQQALTVGNQILSLVSDPAHKELFIQIQHDADYFRRVCLSYALHIRETNIAQQLRSDIELGKPLNDRLAAEMSKVLEADVDNQGGHGKVVEMKRLFAEDAAAFVQNYLLPTEITSGEKGIFTLTSR